MTRPAPPIAEIVTVAWIDRNQLAHFQASLALGTVLFASGLFHLVWLALTGADWEGPLSLRKPGLFGVSAGITVWSIVWVLTQCQPRPQDSRLATILSAGLLVEVGLITLQHWRGVPSHFNRATTLDATIELIMLGLILAVTAGVAWLCWRSCDLRPMPAARAISIRAGLWLLLVSCGLGVFVTIAGEMNVSAGRPPETWGRAGVLKYPHGAALHAIQVLPLLAALLEWWRVPQAGRLLSAAVTAQVLFLVQALWQTLRGRSRQDVDAFSLVLLVLTGALMLFVAFGMMRGAIALWRLNQQAAREGT